SFDSKTETFGAHAVSTYHDVNRVMDLPDGVFPGPWDMKVDAGGTMKDLTGSVRIAAQSKSVLEGEWSASLSPALMVRTALRLSSHPEIFPWELEALGALTASLDISEDESGAFHISSGLVKAKGARVEFDGLFNPRERSAEAASRIYVKQLSAFEPLLPAEVDGDFSATAALRASDARMQATLDLSSEKIRLKPDVSLLRPRILLEMSGTSWWGESEKAYVITSRGDTRLAMPDFTTDEVTYTLEGALPTLADFCLGTLEITDGNAALSGRGEYDLETENGQADITLTIADVARLPGQIARGLGGVVQATAAVSAAPEMQTADLELDVTGVSGLPKAAGAALGDAIHACATADRTKDEVVWKLTEFDSGAFDLSAEGTYTLSDGSLSVSDLVLNISGSQVSVWGDYSPENIDAKAVWDQLPLALSRLAGARPIAGLTSGEASITGSPRMPAVAVQGEIDGLRLDDGVDAEAPSVRAHFEGYVQEGFGSIEFSGNAGDMLVAKGQGRVPLYFGITPWAAALPEEGPLDGAFEINGNLGVVSQFFPNDQHVVEGPFQGRFKVSGTVAQPLVNGEMRVTDARYENLETSTILDEIEAVLEADGDSLQVTTFRAQTIPTGTVNVNGQCALDRSAGYPFSAEVLFEGACLVNRDDLSADLGGTVTLEGGTSGVRVNGDVNIAPAYFRVPEQLPTRVATIVVQEKNVPESAKKPEAIPEPPLPVTIDVRCVVPGRFYVMGKGLDSEWEGELEVQGTPQKPEVTGDLRVRRGELLFLNRRLELKDSTIAFDGSTPVSPYFDIWGTTRASDLDARVHIYGNMNAVELEMESDPPLPEDQVLARLLFNRDL
ncbi:MAG: translocation/assembly module TamB domain-containing protein, partial [Candidatus Hydrogenedentes bacterium]|nr:translocation/assembly module TamB domain-containing protein [Candidatus Hydrogenedentota bacterium]